MKLFNTFLYICAFGLAFPNQTFADMPMPLSKEEILFRNAFSKVQNIYVFENLGSLHERTNNKEKAIEQISRITKFNPIYEQGQTHIKEQISLMLTNLSPSNSYNFNYNRNTVDEYSPQTAQITYKYNIVTTKIDNQDYLLGAIEFQIEIAGNSQSKRYDYQININAEPFLILEGRKNKIDMTSFYDAISRSISNIRDVFAYQQERQNLIDTQKSMN